MIIVLRLRHRIIRDQRLSTHVGLIARAFGADKLYYSGQKDEHLEKSIVHVVDTWGGNFKIEYIKNWKSVVKEYKNKGFIIVHLTMYGLLANEIIKKIKETSDNVLIIIGGEKVPSEAYELADYNVAIGNQPHSEAGALAVFLHMLTDGKEFNIEFEDAKLKIIPSNKGKIVKKLKD